MMKDFKHIHVSQCNSKSALACDRHCLAYVFVEECSLVLTLLIVIFPNKCL
jgi:hypothetical protein